MQMTIRMPDEYEAKIREISEKTGLRKSDIARLALKKFLEEFDRQELQERPFKRARDLVGVVSSGIYDLGANHRRHVLNRIQEQKS